MSWGIAAHLEPLDGNTAKDGASGQRDLAKSSFTNTQQNLDLLLQQAASTHMSTMGALPCQMIVKDAGHMASLSKADCRSCNALTAPARTVALDAIRLSMSVTINPQCSSRPCMQAFDSCNALSHALHDQTKLMDTALTATHSHGRQQVSHEAYLGHFVDWVVESTTATGACMSEATVLLVLHSWGVFIRLGPPPLLGSSCQGSPKMMPATTHIQSIDMLPRLVLYKLHAASVCIRICMRVRRWRAGVVVVVHHRHGADCLLCKGG